MIQNLKNNRERKRSKRTNQGANEKKRKRKPPPPPVRSLASPSTSLPITLFTLLNNVINHFSGVIKMDFLEIYTPDQQQTTAGKPVNSADRRDFHITKVEGFYPIFQTVQCFVSVFCTRPLKKIGSGSIFYA